MTADDTSAEQPDEAAMSTRTARSFDAAEDSVVEAAVSPEQQTSSLGAERSRAPTGEPSVLRESITAHESDASGVELSEDLARMQAALGNLDAVPLDERVEMFQQMNRDIAGYLAELDEL